MHLCLRCKIAGHVVCWEQRIRSVQSACQRLGNARGAGFAFIIYFCLGFFGASRWGAATSGNLLQNVWGPGPYQGTLNTLLGIYLAFTMPPICYPTAHVVKARPKVLQVALAGS